MVPKRRELLSPHGGKNGILSLRSRIACGGWIVVLAILSVSAITSAETGVQALLMLLTVYGLQGWLAELIGVKIDASGISFPNRIFPEFPYLVFFRRKLPKGSFDRVNVVSKQFLVIYSAGDQVKVPIPVRFNRMVAKSLQNNFPKVSVTLLY